MANRAGLKMNIVSVICEIPSLRGSWVQIPLPPLYSYCGVQKKNKRRNTPETVVY